jgi:hypothetical protein
VTPRTAGQSLGVGTVSGADVTLGARLLAALSRSAAVIARCSCPRLAEPPRRTTVRDTQAGHRSSHLPPSRSDAFDESITAFSQRYADQNDRDYQEFVTAIRSGRLEAVEGVENSDTACCGRREGR